MSNKILGKSKFLYQKINQVSLAVFAAFWGSSLVSCKDTVDPNETMVKYGVPNFEESSSSAALSVPLESSSSSAPELMVRYGIPTTEEIASSSSVSNPTVPSSSTVGSSSVSEPTEPDPIMVRYGSPTGGW